MTQEILVVKLGGGAGLDLPAAIRDIAQIARGRPVVVMHGVSARMAELSAERGVPVQTLTSPTGHTSRYTPPPVRDLFVEACDSLNRDICELLWSHNIAARGFTGSLVIQGERKSAIRAVVDGRTRIVRDDYSGSITGVDADALRAALAEGVVPVIPPLAISSDGALNIDGDRAGAAVAAALGAAELVILSNVRGLYRSMSDSDSFIPQVRASQIDDAMNWAQGRMKRKVLGAQEALENGVSRVIIGDGRSTNPVSLALAGEGTTFTR